MRPNQIIFAALLGVSAAQAALAAPAPISIPPLVKAATIQVSEKLTTHQDGKPDDIRFLKIKIARPDDVRIEEAVLKSDGPVDGTPAGLFVTVGMTQYEYAIARKIYFAEPSKPLGEGKLSSRFGLTATAQLPLLLGQSKLDYTLTGTEPLQGKVQHRYETRFTTEDGSYKITLWIDANTHLPTRRTNEQQVEGKWAEVSALDFSGWKLNAPIPLTQFAWAPPDGAKEYVEPVLLAAGTTAPDFTVQDKDGKPIRLSDYAGKVVVLDFWATWCGPCQKSLPHTNEVARQYKDKGVVVLAVNTWDQEKPFQDWLPQHTEYESIQFAIDTADSAHDVAGSLYNVTGIPTQYVISPAGKVVQSFVGYSGPTDDLAKAIKQAAKN